VEKRRERDVLRMDQSPGEILFIALGAVPLKSCLNASSNEGNDCVTFVGTLTTSPGPTVLILSLPIPKIPSVSEQTRKGTEKHTP
jgi:hypothetical protein